MISQNIAVSVPMSQSRDENYLKALQETQEELQQIRTAGTWMVTAGFAAAAFLYVGAVLTAWAAMGTQAFLLMNPLWFAAGATILAGPAIAIILAGFMGRQSMRHARANTLVLRASQMLLMPADAASSRIETLTDKVREETQKVDELVETAHASLVELRATLGTEREEFSELVTKNTKTIASMMNKLAEERQALGELSSAVETQTAAISEAIPRQARAMAEAARLAQHEVAQADKALDDRLTSLNDSTMTLTDKLAALDAMSADAEARSARINASVEEIEQRLTESSKTVETAIRASELAATAATETGDALNSAVANALDGTREASEFIRAQSREAVQEALKGLAELKTAGQQAEAATRAAGDAARSQADETEHRIMALSQMLYDAATRATSTAEAGLERARQRIERASALLNGLSDGDILSAAPAMPEPPAQPAAPQPQPPAPTPVPAPPENLRRRQPDTDEPKPSFETLGEPDKSTSSMLFSQPGQKAAPQSDGETSVQERTPAPESSETTSEESSLFDLAFDNASQKEMGLSWKDLLAGLSSDPEERDDAARIILSEVEDMGIALTDAFTMKETRKIAGASRRNERNRRRAVREYAGSKVQELQYRIEDQEHFHAAVERFLSEETTDAMRSLSEADRSRTAAAKRLTAFLLLDAAFHSQNN